MTNPSKSTSRRTPAPRTDENTSLAVISSEESSISVLAILKEELKNLQLINDTPYKTDGVFDSFRVREEKDLGKLIQAGASIRIREASYNQFAEKELNCENYPTFQVGGKSADDLIHDIKLRYAIVTQEDRKNELEALMKEGESFLSLKDKQTLYNERVAASLSKYLPKK
jgi:hypothetical protein